MANGTITMDNDDWVRIEGIVKAAVEPMNKRLDQLPCLDNTEDITTLKAQRDAAKEQKKDIKESKDWLLKTVLAAVSVLVGLQAVGFFRSLSK